MEEKAILVVNPDSVNTIKVTFLFLIVERLD